MTVEEWKRKNPPIQHKPITNAGRIRSMSDEELASYLYDMTATAEDSVACYVCEGCGKGDCMTAWLKWLKQEAKE